jgi:hypothetical protein
MRSQNNRDSLVHINVRRKPKPTVKNYQPLGYILYDATTSSWVTFSYELTGFGRRKIVGGTPRQFLLPLAGRSAINCLTGKYIMPFQLFLRTGLEFKE